MRSNDRGCQEASFSIGFRLIVIVELFSHSIFRETWTTSVFLPVRSSHVPFPAWTFAAFHLFLLSEQPSFTAVQCVFGTAVCMPSLPAEKPCSFPSLQLILNHPYLRIITHNNSSVLHRGNMSASILKVLLTKWSCCLLSLLRTYTHTHIHFDPD